MQITRTFLLCTTGIQWRFAFPWTCEWETVKIRWQSITGMSFYSNTFLAVRYWSINVLLAFNQASPNGIWLNTSSGKEQNHKKKYNSVFFQFFSIKTGIMICLNVLVWYLPTNAYSASAPLCGATWSAGFRSVLYSSITLVASHRSYNRQMVASKPRAMAFFELPVWNITTAWFLFPLYSRESMTRKCRIMLLFLLS